MKISIKRLRGHLKKAAVAPVPVRSRPGQSQTSRYKIGQGLNAWAYLKQFALSPWVYAAITRMSEGAANARLDVVGRYDHTQIDTSHPILGLLGDGGMPNEYQSRLEFLEEHFAFLDLAGNSFWFWYSQYGGSPTAVYNLNPARVRVLPGRDRVVGGYEYRFEGHTAELSPDQVTHFKRFNPYSDYYGMPALESLLVEITGDRAMAEWNLDFFGDGVAIPAGIFVVDENILDEDLERLEYEINAKYSEKRRTAVVRAAPGSTAFFDAGLKQREMDFNQGREFGRKAVYEVLDLPLGVMSEASTEAHARVAERFFYTAVQRRLKRTQEKINSGAMRFWPGWDRWSVRFEDLRARHADWQQEKLKIESWLEYRTKNEIRQEYGLPEIKEQPAGATGQPDRGDFDPLSEDRQI